MNRRDFLQTMATRTAAAGALGLMAGCGAAQVADVPSSEAIVLLLVRADVLVKVRPTLRRP